MLTIRGGSSKTPRIEASLYYSFMAKKRAQADLCSKTLGRHHYVILRLLYKPSRKDASTLRTIVNHSLVGEGRQYKILKQLLSLSRQNEFG